MGIAERKEREKEQKQNAIIDAAEKVIFSKGLEAATIPGGYNYYIKCLRRQLRI